MNPNPETETFVGRLAAWMPWVALFGLLPGFVGGLGFGGKRVDLLWVDPVILAVGFCLTLDLFRRGRFSPSRYHLPIGLMIATMLLSFYNADDVLKACGYMKIQIIGIGGFWIVDRWVRQPQQRRLMFMALPIWSLLLSAMIFYVIAQIGFTQISEEMRERIHAPLGASNYLAAFQVALIPLCLGAVALAPNALLRWAFRGAAAVGAVSVLLTLSRGALVSLIAAALLGMGLAGRRAIMPLAGLALLLVAFLATEMGDEYVERIDRKIQENRPTSGRLEIWEECYLLWSAHPIVGAGLGATRIATDRSSLFLHPVEAHNILIGALAETGVLGFLALLFFGFRLAEDLWNGWRRARKKPGEESATVWVACGISFAALFMHSLLEPTLTGAPFYLFFMMMVGLVHRMRVAQLDTPQHDPT